MNEAAVLGTWAYSTKGVSSLQDGTFRVRTKEDRLVVQVRDRWRGSITGRVYVRGNRMEIRLKRVQISGQIAEDRFTASVQRDRWDVSRARRQNTRGSLVARRIDKPMNSNDSRDFGCQPLLLESSYACSPLPENDE